MYEINEENVGDYIEIMGDVYLDEEYCDHGDCE